MSTMEDTGKEIEGEEWRGVGGGGNDGFVITQNLEH